ncbi:CDP-alcohol phosphatidyltransferase [Phytophthora infestans]|uniref:CDP-alcohol phosphatidyltransferase n=1 Tax=Phytophthora infestans TaxID=4787 RepID=A0A833W4G4_PHYIN|nr:CDP-alcohol phosphatidyltransferase [Phytophthora infestans]KAF4128438.1 CDP-alcohol phosphatidyltransferase [Phytophthora infestans]
MVLTRSAAAAAKPSPTEAEPGAPKSQPEPKTKQRNYRYVTEDGVKRILTYHYSGSDASLLYSNVISPLAQWLVDHVLSPRLAPNAITIGALSLVILSHVIMLWYSPNMVEEAPRWVYANAGFSLLFYQVLDVADGKQARKTGNSSPLGLLFDHGCDALNVVVSACTFASTLVLGPTYWSLLMFLAPAMVFFMATWEEYYTGTLALPTVNGPNEGLLFIYSVYIGTAIVGPNVWTQPNIVFPQLNNGHVVVLGSLTTGIAQCVFSAVIAIRSMERKAKDGAAALFGITPFVALVLLSGLWVLWSPSDVFTDHPRLLIWTVGLLFAKMVMHMMLSHMCDEPYWLLRKTFIIQLVVSFLLVVGIVPWGHESSVVQLFFMISLAAYLHMIYFLSTELATILGIHIFKVKQG